MLDQVESCQKDLDAKVQMRTEDLRSANAELVMAKELAESASQAKTEEGFTVHSSSSWDPGYLGVTEIDGLHVPVRFAMITPAASQGTGVCDHRSISFYRIS